MIHQPKIQFLKNSYSEHDLKQMKGSELVPLYNIIASNLGEKPVKKFTDLKTAVKRTWKILNWYAEYDAEPASTDLRVRTEEVKQVKKVLPSNKKPGIGKFAKELIKAGKSPVQIVEEIKEKFPSSKVTTRDVAWYKCKMEKNND